VNALYKKSKHTLYKKILPPSILHQSLDFFFVSRFVHLWKAWYENNHIAIKIKGKKENSVKPLTLKPAISAEISAIPKAINTHSFNHVGVNGVIKINPPKNDPMPNSTLNQYGKPKEKKKSSESDEIKKNAQ